MTDALGILYFIFRWVCYAALLIVVAGFGAMIWLSASGMCPTLGTGGIVCQTPFQKEIATHALSIVLVTIFTGIPGILAIFGAGFLLHRLFKWRNRRKAAKGQSEPGAGEPSFFMFLIKFFGVLMALAFVGGIVAGMLNGK